MRDYHVLVLHLPETAAAATAIVSALQARGLGAWSDAIDERDPSRATLGWADAIVLVDPTPDASHARTAGAAWTGRSRVLVAAAPPSGVDRITLLADGFDHILSLDDEPSVIAAFTERVVHRGALPVAAMHGADRLR